MAGSTITDARGAIRRGAGQPERPVLSDEEIAALLKGYLTVEGTAPESRAGQAETVQPEARLVAQLGAYLRLLLKWNSRTNLTAIREPAEIVRRHFGESLFAAQHLDTGGHPGIETDGYTVACGETGRRSGGGTDGNLGGDSNGNSDGNVVGTLDGTFDGDMGGSEDGDQGKNANGGTDASGFGTLLDFGSGAGFPGLPIQLLRPGIKVTLAESQNKKAAFLREAVRTLGLATEVWAGRVEAMPRERQFDVVTLRAVDRMDLAVEAASARVGRRMVLMTTAGGRVPPPQGLVLAGRIPIPGGNGLELVMFDRPGQVPTDRSVVG